MGGSSGAPEGNAVGKSMVMIVGIGLTLCALGGLMSTLEKPTGPSVTPVMRTAATRLINHGDNIWNSDDSIWNVMAEMTDLFGPRFSGSKNLEDAISWIMEKEKPYLNENYTIYEEFVDVPQWVRGKESAVAHFSDADSGERFRTKKLHMVGLGMSNGTNGQTLTAEVIVLSAPVPAQGREFEELDRRCGEVAGKIVLFNNEWIGYSNSGAYRRLGAVNAAKCGAVAVLIRSVAPYSMQNPHTGSSQTAPIPAAALSVEDAKQFQRVYDRNQVITVELYMEAQFKSEVRSRNLIIEIPGHERIDQYVLVSGHIDSWDIAEGAMDDGGGALTAWQALRMMRDLKIRPRRTIRAVLWTNEENGAAGGHDYARRHFDELHAHSLAMECDAGTFNPYRLGFTGSDAARTILKDLGTLLEPIGSGAIGPTGGGVDIDPLCRAGNVPCSSLDVQDFRVGGRKRLGESSINPCEGFNKLEENPSGPGVYADSYFWLHHTTAEIGRAHV